jgi:hypothetical protein
LDNVKKLRNVRTATKVFEDANLPSDLRSANRLQHLDHALVANPMVASEDIAVFSTPDSTPNRGIVNVPEMVGKRFVIVVAVCSLWRTRRAVVGDR